MIFNALIIVALIPASRSRVSAPACEFEKLLNRNLLIYGLGGLVAPFIGIKVIDLVVSNIPGIG